MDIVELEKTIAEQRLVADLIGIERVFVEGYFCPRCHRNLVYQGYRRPDEETICYGVCRCCNYVREFYFNSPRLAQIKRRFSGAGNRKSKKRKAGF